MNKQHVVSLIADEFGVTDMLGIEEISKGFDGERWEDHVNNLAETFIQYVQELLREER